MVSIDRRDNSVRRRLLCALVATVVVVYACALQNPRSVDAAAPPPGTINVFAGGNGAGMPGFLATDPSGNVYISETGAEFRVRLACQQPATGSCFTPFGTVTGQSIGTIAGDGVGGYTGDGGLATNAKLSPVGLAVDPSGNLFIGQSGSAIRYVCMAPGNCATAFGTMTSGEIITVAGGTTPGFAGDGGPASHAELDNPGALASDSNGNLYIADSGNHRVRFVCMKTSACSTAIGQVASTDIVTIAGTGTSSNTGDGGPAANAALTPSSLALDQSGNLYVGTGAAGTVRSICVLTSVCGTSLGIMNSGNIVTVAGNGATCTYTRKSPCGDGGLATNASLSVAGPIAVDAAGNLIVADSGANLIRVVCLVASCPTYLSARRNIAQGDINTIAGTGTSGSSGDGGPANSAAIESVDGIGIDGANDVFLSQGAASAPFVRQVTTPVTLQVYATPLYAGFPLTPVGPGPSSLAVTVTNPTGSTVRGGPTTVSGANASDFLVNDGCNGASLAPRGTCTVGLTFEPHQSSQLDRTATLDLTDSGGPTTAQTVGLFGQAPPQPTITAVTPTSGTGTSATTVTVTGTNLQYVTSASFGTTGKTDAVTHDPTTPDTKLLIASPGTTNPLGGTVDITVNGTGGTSATSSADHYTFSPWGRLRVTTPNLPTIISVDGNVADTWSTNSVHEDAGTHTICYSDVEGWATPACQTVTVLANETTTIAAAFVQRGWLRVQLSPAGVDGTISVDGTPMDDYGVWTDLSTGSHQVCFLPVAEYTPPPCQSVTLTAGNTLAVTGTYTSSPGAPGRSGTGMLRVTTSPAVDSQISVDGMPRDTWALDWLQLPGGSATHQVCFRSVAGFAPPPCSTVTITAGQTTTVNGVFTQHGYIDATVGFGGLDLVISVDGVGRDDGTVWTEFPVGTHTVCFGAVQTEAAPPCQTATVTAGNTADIFGTYGS